MQDTDKKVVIQRNFPTSVERLWDAFTKVEDILKWQSPVGMTTPFAEVELKVGGLYAVTMEYDSTSEKVTVRGTYKEIQKPTKLVYTWKWDGQEEETEVTVIFREISHNETEVTLTQVGFAEKASADDVANHRTRDDHNAGWTTAFDKLELLYRNPTYL